MIDDLIAKLKKRLKEPLPGGQAHEKMKPILPSGARLKGDPSKARLGAVMLLLYQDKGEWYFPLIQRPLYEGVHSGQVAFPGGRKEESDVDLFETALRESNEEIGIQAQNVEVIGTLSKFFVAVSNYMVLPVVSFHEGKPQFVPDAREVDHVIEAPLSQLMNIDLLKEKEILAASGYRLRSPYFEIEQKTVWGATAMMLSEFVDIVKEL
ncbi:MAG: CoA pyrophosphatase [Cyclobacteriaceae bacterium]